jgi:hypothetical protein
MLRRSYSLAILVANAVVACGSHSAPDPCLGTVSAAIVGGTPAPDGAPPDDGIGYVWVELPTASGRRVTRLCTVTRTRRGKAVTAAHCIGAVSQWQAWIGFGAWTANAPDGCGPAAGELHAVGGHTPHPTLDVDVLDFDDPDGTAPVLAVTDAVPSVGAAVELAGYGMTENGAYAGKRFAPSVVVSEDDRFVTVNSAGITGACTGDSGGPLLARDQASAYRVVGILSGGSADCRGSDIYVSGHVASWLETVGAR